MRKSKMSEKVKSEYWKNYYREYSRKYKHTKRYNNSGVGGYVFVELGAIPEYVKFDPINERTLRIKDQRCQWHRCNKKLTYTEKLYGNNCSRHSIGQTPNVNNLLKLFK